MLTVKNHDHTSPSHLKLDLSCEPPLDSTTPKNYMYAVEHYPKCGWSAYRAGLSTNPKLIVDSYTIITYEESQVYIEQLVKELQNAGLKKGDRCILYAKNSPLWLYTDYAISFAGGIVAPVFDTLSLDNIEYIINLINAKFIFVSADYLPNVLGMAHKLPSVTQIFCFDKMDKEQTKQQTRKVYL